MKPDAPADPDAPATTPARGTLREIALLFTRLGFTAFGGPAAHLAMMEDEVVKRRRWLSREQFLDLAATLNFIPGPNSTELAIHLGLIRGGLPGLVVAGFCFIVPAVLIILPIAWMYVRYASAGVQTPAVVLGGLQGIAAIVVAILAMATWRFAPAAWKSRRTLIIALAAFPAELLLARYTALQPEIVILAAAAVFGAFSSRRASPAVLPVLIPPAGWLGLVNGTARWLAALPILAGTQGEFLRLAWFFLEVGGALFGRGYVLVSYLDAGLVEQYNWLTRREVADAVAVGQVTPGPLLTTATFAGYLRGHAITGTEVGGMAGALLATIAIFLPAFVLVAVFGRLLPTLRAYPPARGALDAMNAAVVMLLAIVTVRFAVAALAGPALVLPAWLTGGLACGALVLLLRTRVNSTVLIGLGALAGGAWAAAV